MRQTPRARAFVFSLTVWFLLLAANAQAQTRPIAVEYTVKVASTDDRLFHVTTDIKNISQPSLDLSLPVWTPGWYTIENYAKNILRFKVTDAKGARLPHMMTRKQTWRVNTRGLDRIKVEFDYQANVLALNQAKITKDFAFFTGTQLFLLAEGHRRVPCAVRFEVPAGWKIVTALQDTADPMVFTAPDYDMLVDSPTEMGNFDMMKFEVDGKPHYFVSTPAGAFSKEKSAKFVEILTQIAKTQKAIFGDLPYQKYVYYYFFAPAESNAGGGLEHNNSFVAFSGSGATADPDGMAGLAAHEFFHAWNVKRIRPAQMWPYDYSRENESPLLWVSEGFTNYYTNVSLYRAGLRSREQFLESVAGAMNGVENEEARHYISPADASTSTWLGYDTPVAFGISYYTQGQNLGALLDLSILNDTKGKARLDDVMRALYREHYQKGRGFSTEDLLRVITRIAGRDYHDFFRRYILGVEVPPYEQIFGYAGYRLEKLTRKVPEFGFGIRGTPQGLQVSDVEPDSAAAKAGLQPGDILLTVDGADIRRARIDEKVGQTVKVGIKRGEEDKTLDMLIEGREVASSELVEVTNPTPAQSQVREAWLKK
ncbi:MAG TPA: PDZ domain-containing protein [Blastocatellia bacterium]|nr:PDZ domain-containing protein [Blastocatellia bacterium]